ncbi:MAG: hypothetical protein JO015_05320 [Verrucomicrobia bacterium]|nr:hypothetical protein [Verrucomicrobiota bacterium]
MKARLCILGLLAVASLLLAPARAASAVALGTNGHWATCHFGNQPLAVVEKRAIESCRLAGGINPRVIASSASPGYAAVAYSRARTTSATDATGARGTSAWAIGCAFGAPTQNGANRQAIENCRKHGGTKPEVRSTWLDAAQGFRL